MDKKTTDLIFKYCLQNAISYSGKANPGAVLGKVLSENPDLRKDVDVIRKAINDGVMKVNHMNPEEQNRLFQESGFEIRKSEKVKGLPELRNAEIGKVVTRFAPSPTGPLNISHTLRGVLISYIYARKYKGRFILRFEDTDAKKVEKRYYDWIQEDLRNLGVEWDKLIIQSERMALYYKYAGEMIDKGSAFVCTCSQDDFKKYVMNKEVCKCWMLNRKENAERWKKLLEGGYKEGEAVLRLKTDMKSPNPVLRCPALFRISKVEHPLAGKKYNAWPLYNFANVIDDHEEGVTHVFRGKEHEHNTAVQDIVYSDFKWKPPTVINFGMIYLPGEKLHTRDIKEGIKEGKYSGWDDIKLFTLRSLFRRGFQPEAFFSFAEQTGLSKTDIVIGIENLEGHNKKIIDKMANRYMVVIDPIKLSVSGVGKGFEKKEVRMSLHPEIGRGEKTVPVDIDSIYVCREDIEKYGKGELRLKELFNVRFEEGKVVFSGNEIVKGMQKIQWVSEPHVKVIVHTPEGLLEGLGEDAMKSLKVGDIIQMERVGFGRVDKKGKGLIEVYFAHK